MTSRTVSAVDGDVAGGPPWDSPGLRAAFAVSAANLNLHPIWRTSVYATSRELYFVPTQFAHDYAAVLVLLGGFSFVRQA
jgi:hypothetical protein